MLDMRQIGQNIAELHRNCDMTQMELADRMGISFQAVSNWERGLQHIYTSRYGCYSGLH